MMFKTINNAAGKIGVASLNGRLDAVNCLQLCEQFNSWLTETNRFIFDCDTLDFVDSSGLGAIVSCLRKSMAADGDLLLINLGPKVAMIFDLTRANQLFTTYSDLDEALSAYAEEES